MTIRARRVFPGMVVSMLLAGPAFAGTQAVDNAAIHTRKAPHPIVSPRKTGPTRSSTASRTPAPRPAERARDEQRASFVEDTSVWSDSPTAGRSRGLQTRLASQQTGLASQQTGLASRQTGLASQQTGLASRQTGLAFQQTGLASWYGGARWAGHMTASGARYNENELTAAHASLPIGTRVIVAVSSGRSVIVTINDRPGTHRRVIDLSREAARQLGIMGQGVATVTLTPL
jgi:rare lipoprotein A (peptidoglycan hydrolase)